MRRREVQQPVVGAGWFADEHALEHFLDHPQTAGIADEIGAEFAMARAAERHVVAQDVVLAPLGYRRTLERQTGLSVLNLPKEKTYHVGLHFPL